MPGLDESIKAQMKTIEGVEIFSEGVWNGDKYTLKDLDEMVENFQKTKQALRPYLKLGHDDKQKLIQNDGLPSIGFIENVRRVGKKLVADFTNVPKKIYELIARKAYHRVSSEIYINFKEGKETLGKVLKAVSLLGGDTPAVSNLDDILSLYAFDYEQAKAFKEFYASNGEARAQGCEIVEVTFGTDNKKSNQEETEMEEMKEKLATLEKQYAEAVAELKKFQEKEQGEVDALKGKVEEMEKANQSLKAELDKVTGERDGLSAKFAEAQKAALVKEVEAKVEELISNKKLLPAQKEKAFALLLHSKGIEKEKKFSINEKEVAMDELVISLFNENILDINTDEATSAGERQQATDGSAKTKEMEFKIGQYMEKHKVAYKEAMTAVYPDGVPNTDEEIA
jgi:hypothetical protein